MVEIAVALGFISIVVAIATVKYAELKYGGKNDVSELAKKIEMLEKHVTQAKKDQLHERVSRIETATGVKLFG